MSTVRKVPLRKCIGCNEMKNKKEMIRVVKTTEGTIVPDTTGRMNGRGAYVCSLECLGPVSPSMSISSFTASFWPSVTRAGNTTLRTTRETIPFPT